MFGDPHRNRGFSTVEMLIAIGVLTFGVYGVYDRFIETGQAMSRQVWRTQSDFAAKQRLAELKAVPLAELKAWTPPDRAEKTPEGRWVKPEIKPIDGGGVEIAVTAGWGSEPAPGEAPPVDRAVAARVAVLP